MVKQKNAVKEPAAAVEVPTGIIDDFFAQQNDAEPSLDLSVFRCGYVAIVGRPNVGKSTLMNHLIGQKLSITSRKPQTTRHRIMGIDTRDDVQAIYVDTPGMHLAEVRAMNKLMNQAATSALTDVDVVLFVVDALKWTPDDELVLSKLQHMKQPIILVINKVDTIARKSDLLPYIEQLYTRLKYSAVIPVCALKSDQLTSLFDLIKQHLPVNPPLFASDQITDRSSRFLASEIVREKIMRQLGDELPYDLTVQIDSLREEPAFIHTKTKQPKPACTYIDATIFVEREGQKIIVIGQKGARIKKIGSDARIDMESLFERKIMLTLWVKVKAGWSDDERALKSLGYGDS